MKGSLLTLLTVLARASDGTVALVAIHQWHTSCLLIAFVIERVTGIGGLRAEWTIPALLADATERMERDVITVSLL